MPKYTRHTASWHDFPSTDTSIDAVDLEGWETGLLNTNADVVGCFWNGTTYVTKSGQVMPGDNSKPREFLGAVDPASLSTYVENVFDTWAQYT